MGGRAEAVMRRYLEEVVGQQRFELIAELAADDMVDHTQPGRGPAALEAHARGFCAGIEGLEVEVELVAGTDEVAVGVWRWSGTPSTGLGRSASGALVYPRRVASVFQVRDGRIVDYRPFVDAVEVARQLAAE